MNAQNAKPTPGPWTFQDGVACISHKRGDITAHCRGNSLLVAHVSMRTDPSYNGDDDTANARLIAAAPELLKALSELISDADLSGITAHYKGRGFDESIEKARVAIAKATGVQQ